MGKLTMYGKPRDSQRSKVYNWQYDNLPEGKRLSLREIDLLVWDIYSTYGYRDKMPDVIVTKAKKSYSHYLPGDHQIRLASGWGQDTRIVLHETVHALMYTMGIGKRTAWHGSEFMDLFLEVCELWLDMSPRQLSAATIHSAILRR